MENQKIKQCDNPKAIISPSILSCDFTIFYEECKQLLENGVDQLHVDIMDGHFVPNLTLGPQIVKYLKKRFPTTFLDCHLMVTHPKKWVLPFGQAGADQFTFHIEADFEGKIEELTKMIHENKMKVGLALNPKTEVTKEIEELIQKEEIDTILIMTVYPGFGGQKFMESEVGKAKYLREKFPGLNIEVDGGIGVDNIDIVAKNGINNVVSGTGIVNQKDQKLSLIHI
eukprot:TRINITY_DN1122_c0_g1_i2.p1 TRINITY_DN1122_c0_g1~~TRINITY_DN1122_c0_g1_i2.p1  ORF type:complete len:227 (+),score=48.32 TRINITY_DN1122_c0_g1_i2:81-761(+)